MIDWKDDTSYSRGQRGVIEPSVWSLNVHDLTFKVHRHLYYPDTWLLSCVELEIKCHDLDTNEISEAKRLAIRYMKNVLMKYITRYQNVWAALEFDA